MKIKRILLFMGILVLAFLTACGNSTDNNVEEDLDNLNETGMPIVDEEITLDIFTVKGALHEDFNDVLIFNEYKDRTNINVEWEMVPGEGFDEKLNLALSSDDLPDAFYNASIAMSDLLKYGNQGTFIPLNDLIADYAPNLQKIFDEHPEIESALTQPDGNIYGLPTLDEPGFDSKSMGSQTWFREDWLEQLDMEVPETTDEFYEFLKAVKETDLIGDGSNDEIPFGTLSIGLLVEWLEGSFGVGNRGLSVGKVDMDPNEEKLRFYPITDEYKELLEYVHKLYDEELIEQNIFSLESHQFFANGTEGIYGSVERQDPEQVFGGEHNDKYIGGFALEGPNGHKSYTGTRHPVDRPGAFVITEGNEHPAATMRWIDYFYGDEGSELFLMGIEGETFEINEDGDHEYVEDIRDNPEGLTLDQAVARYLTWPGGGYPAYNKEKYYKGSEGTEATHKAVEKIKPDLIEEVWPAFSYTEEENRIMQTTGADIEKYVDESTDKFISGDMSFDQWDEYVQTIKDMNLEEYMEIQQNAYERYESN